MRELEYEDYFYEETKRCPHCETAEARFDDCREFFGELVKQLYIDKKLDISHIEFLIEELCEKLCVKFPHEHTLNLSRRPTVLESVKEWKQTNLEYLKQLAS